MVSPAAHANCRSMTAPPSLDPRCNMMLLNIVSPDARHPQLQPEPGGSSPGRAPTGGRFDSVRSEGSLSVGA
eukprot:scaffold201055_cov29-Tisochrysis_lutea.AAC.12